jgi:hypothetical protein
VCSIGKMQTRPIVTFSHNSNIDVVSNEYGLLNNNSHKSSEIIRGESPKMVVQINSMKNINNNANLINRNIVLFN